MELRELRTFLAVVRAGSVTRAAEELHITQPALSRQIMSLERELDCKLLDRGRHGAQPTEDGLLLVRRAEALVELADKTESELRSSGKELEGTLTICCGQVAALDELARLVSSFREAHPHVRVSIIITTSQESSQRLQEGRADLAVILNPFDPCGLEFVHFRTRERWVAVMPIDDPLATRESVTAADLAQGPIILPFRPGVQSVLANWFGKRFESLNIAGTANLIAAGNALARSRIGRSLQIACEHDPTDLVSIPLEPPLETDCVLVWLQGRPASRVARAFTDFARERLGND